MWRTATPGRQGKGQQENMHASLNTGCLRVQSLLKDCGWLPTDRLNASLFVAAEV